MKSFVQRLALAFKQRSETVMRNQSIISEMQEKKEKLFAEIENLKRKVDPCIEEVRLLKSFVEAEISAVSKRRPVHIVGEINNILRRS